MALIINKQVTLYDELVIDSFYVRLYFRSSLDGKSLHITYFPYLSKESFKANADNNIKFSFNLNRGTDLTIDYDRKKDGVDILNIVHEAIKKSLSTDITEEVDTGEVDEHGNPIIEIVVVREKFTDVGNITNDLSKEKPIETS